MGEFYQRIDLMYTMITVHKPAEHMRSAIISSIKTLARLGGRLPSVLNDSTPTSSRKTKPQTQNIILQYY